MTGFASRDRRQSGEEAERFAADLLRRQGFRIVDRNVRYRFGEIDLVVDDGETLVFVEVRARRAGLFGRAIETLTYQKRRRVYRSVERYLQERQIDPNRPVRIDVVAIELDAAGRPSNAEVVTNAFGET